MKNMQHFSYHGYPLVTIFLYFNQKHKRGYQKSFSEKKYIKNDQKSCQIFLFKNCNYKLYVIEKRTCLSKQMEITYFLQFFFCQYPLINYLTENAVIEIKEISQVAENDKDWVRQTNIVNGDKPDEETENGKDQENTQGNLLFPTEYFQWINTLFLKCHDGQKTNWSLFQIDIYTQ